MAGVQVFRYIEELDAFVVNDEFRQIADRLGLSEWHPAVWIGRLFTQDKYLLNNRGKDLTGAPVEKSARQKSCWAHLSGLAFTTGY